MYYWDCYRKREAVLRGIFERIADVFAITTEAASDSMYRMWLMNLSHPISNSIRTKSKDHIIYPIQHEPTTMFNLFFIFDFYVWITFMIATIATALSVFFLYNKTTFLENFWFVSTSSWHPVSNNYQGNKKWFLGLWCLLIMVLTYCYSGQLYTVITMEPKALIIDSWDDLAVREDVPIIAGSDLDVREDPVKQKKSQREIHYSGRLAQEFIEKATDTF